jgi:Glyoxalase/Bleomycin resistance protein/Dioxygenase superfamily
VIAMPLTKGFYETAYVTRDLDAALDVLAKREGIKQFFAFAPPASRGPVSHIAKVAKGFVGERMIEIIQPNPTVKSMFEGYVPKKLGQLRFHHLGYIVDGNAHWDAICLSAAKAGFPIAYEGFVEGMVRSIFFDTRNQLGHFSEYIQNYEGGQKLLTMIPHN